MIESTLTNIKRYLEYKFEEAGHPEWNVKLETLKKDEEPEYGVYVTLLRIEEETSIKQQTRFHRDSKEKGHYRNPDLCVNLFILVSVYAEDYSTGLTQISSVLSVINNVEDFSYLLSEDESREYNESLDAAKKEVYEAVKELSIELQTLSAEQTNSLWQTVGTKIVPAVCYKIRMITISDKPSNVKVPIIKKETEVNAMGTFKKNHKYPDEKENE